MNKSMILELVSSGKCYMERINVLQNVDYKKSLGEVDELLDKLCEGMTEQEKHDALLKFESAQGGLEATTADEYFKEGFKLGLKLAAQNFLD